jgi:hypothetical protein
MLIPEFSKITTSVSRWFSVYRETYVSLEFPVVASPAYCTDLLHEPDCMHSIQLEFIILPHFSSLSLRLSECNLLATQLATRTVLQLYAETTTAILHCKPDESLISCLHPQAMPAQAGHCSSSCWVARSSSLSSLLAQRYNSVTKLYENTDQKFLINMRTNVFKDKSKENGNKREENVFVIGSEIRVVNNIFFFEPPGQLRFILQCSS